MKRRNFLKTTAFAGSAISLVGIVRADLGDFEHFGSSTSIGACDPVLAVQLPSANSQNTPRLGLEWTPTPEILLAEDPDCPIEWISFWVSFEICYLEAGTENWLPWNGDEQSVGANGLRPGVPGSHGEPPSSAAIPNDSAWIKMRLNLRGRYYCPSQNFYGTLHDSVEANIVP